MQFIQELPPIVQVIDAAALILAITLIVLSRRRRRASMAVAMTATPAAAGKGKRSKDEKRVPRRKRRKLAAEGAQSMGVDAEAAAAVDRIVVPPVEIAPPPAAPTVEADAPPPMAAAVEVTEVAEVAQVAVSDDPYVSDDFEPIDAPEGVVVADPGWPTPGELASGFDPDAFDPLPEVRDEPEAYEEYEGYEGYEGYDEEIDPETPTGVIEIPAVATSEVEVLGMDDAPADDGQEWADDFDPATGWADQTEEHVEASEPEWQDDSDRPADVADEELAVAVAEAVDAQEADECWGEPDEEWQEPEALEIEQPEVPAEIAAAAAILPEDESAWTDESGVWPAAEADDAPRDLTVPFPVPGTIPAHDEPVTGAVWTVRSGASNPVVLDLAGVAASGQALELVIEPNGDGGGVRLRIAAAAPIERAPLATDAPGGSEPAIDVAVDASDAVVVEADPDVDAMDVPFLTGGLPSPDPQEPAAAAGIPSADEPASDDPETLHVPYLEDEDPFDAIAAVEVAPVDVFTETAFALEEPVGVATSEAAPPDDDPAKILADIRARLAALDARRS